MKKNKNKLTVFLGIFSVLLLAAASCYSIAFNDARLVAPTDFSEFVFRASDVPMIISGLFFGVYVLYLFVLLAGALCADRRRKKDTKTTRKISPKCGFLGFSGFFYEGKMSETLMDERYEENRMKASFTAYRIGLAIIFLAAIILGQGRLMGNPEYTFIAFIIIVAFSFALVLFLSEYLLYYYDHDDNDGADYESGE